MASTFTDTTAYTFEYVDMKQQVADALTAQLANNNFNFGPVRVFKSDPLDDTVIPAIGVNVVSNDEGDTGIGLTTQSPSYDPTSQTYTEYMGAFMQESVEVRVFCKNADQRDQLRIFVLGVLFAMRPSLLQQGIQQIKLRGGPDEQDNQLLSVPLFMNGTTMSYLNPLNVQVNTTSFTVSDVTGTGNLTD